MMGTLAERWIPVFNLSSRQIIRSADRSGYLYEVIFLMGDTGNGVSFLRCWFGTFGNFYRILNIILVPWLVFEFREFLF